METAYRPVITMRDLSRTEESETRARFEEFSDGVRNKKIGLAISAASGAYTGFTVGGPIGAVIGGVLGVLTGLWGLKSYRAGVYAELEAAGMVSRPRTRSRSVMDRHISTVPSIREFPHSRLVSYAVIDVLSKQYPQMSDEEINAEAYAIVKTFDEFRRNSPDVPIEVCAEVILLLNGIRRNANTGDYETFVLEFPEEPPPPMDYYPPAAEPRNNVRIAWWLAAVALIIFALRKK